MQRDDAAAARGFLEQALAIVEAGDPEGLRPEILLALGNAEARDFRFVEAEERFEAAAEATRDAAVFADANINLARVDIELNRANVALLALEAAEEGLAAFPGNGWKAERLAALGELYHLADRQLRRTDHLQRALTVLDDAGRIARAAGEPRIESLAYGNLGRIAEHFGEREKALEYTRLAVLKAQQDGALNKLYEWQWQAARILEASGQTDLAIAAYDQAIDTLESIRPELSRSSPRSFSEYIAPLFFGLAELLLSEHLKAPYSDRAQDYLRQVQDTIERFKVAEIQNYFHEECVVSDEYEKALEEIAQDAAVIYPIIFDDRLEVLASFGGTMRRHTVMIPRDELTRTVTKFRERLTDYPTHGYRLPGRKLYNWLVRPILGELRSASVGTLVFVPDGPLRTIPPGALHDGRQFLIEEFAVASSLGLSLTNPKSLGDQPMKALTGV